MRSGQAILTRRVAGVEPDSSWRTQALCAQIGWFLHDGMEGTPGREAAIRATAAKRICAQCPVIAECLAATLAVEAGWGRAERQGIFGGKGPRERAALDTSTVKRTRGPTR